MVRCLVAALTLLTALGASAQMPPPPTKLSSVMPPDAPANPPFSFGAIAAFQRKLADQEMRERVEHRVGDLHFSFASLSAGCEDATTVGHTRANSGVLCQSSCSTCQ